MAAGFRAVVRFVLRGTKRLAVTVLGFVLLGAGLAGLLLPVLPGWLLIVAGFAVLGTEYAWARHVLQHARRQATRVRRRVRRRSERASYGGVEVDLLEVEEVVDLTEVERADTSA